MRLPYAALEVIRHDDLGHPAEEVEGPLMCTDPVGQRLRPGGLPVSVVRRAEHGHEDLGLFNLSRLGVNDLGGRAGVIDSLIAGAVLLDLISGDGGATTLVFSTGP